MQRERAVEEESLYVEWMSNIRETIFVQHLADLVYDFKFHVVLIKVMWYGDAEVRRIVGAGVFNYVRRAFESKGLVGQR